MATTLPSSSDLLKLIEDPEFRISLSQSRQIGTLASHDPHVYSRLFNLLTIQPRVAQNAAWALQYAGDLCPESLSPHFHTAVHQLGSFAHHAADRAILRTLALWKDYPDEGGGLLLDKCAALLQDNHAETSLRYHAMLIMYHYCQKEPELVPEFLLLLEQIIIHGSKGCVSRAKKLYHLTSKSQRS